MKITETDIEELLILEPRVFEDERGYFFESYNKSKLPKSLKEIEWVQDNESKSTIGVLRGLHYQIGHHAQAKLVRAISGEIYDVAVDLRIESKTYGQWHGIILSEENKKQFLVPRGFAHGFLVLSETAIFAYKCDNYYNKDAEAGIRYDDNILGIKWPLCADEIVVSTKDNILPIFGQHQPTQL